MEMSRRSLEFLLGTDSGMDCTFHTIQLDFGQEKLDKTLYLSTTPSPRPQSNVLWCIDPSQFNRVFQLHQKYLHWRENSLRLANIDHDLNTLLEISAEFFGWDIWIVTPEYKMDAGAVFLFGHHLQLNQGMPRAEVEQLYQENPDFDDTYQLRGIQPYPNTWVEHTNLFFYNMFQENLYLGRLLFLVPESHSIEKVQNLMMQVCSDVESCYRFLYLRKQHNHPSYRLYNLWRELLQGGKPDSEAIHEALTSRHWQENDEYAVLYLVSAGYFNAQQTLKYYAVELERTFPSCIAAELDGGLYCLHNLTAENSPDFRQKLGEFLRENLFRVGISNSFRNFYDSPHYRAQAEDALIFGQKRDPSLWRYEFFNYVTDYVLSQCLSKYPAKDLCPENLRLLLDYDEQHPDSELVSTLYHYYTCQFNAQLAAQKMFIHRTTFFYRMNKIRKIATFHPETPRETAQILLAFEALGTGSN